VETEETDDQMRAREGQKNVEPQKIVPSSFFHPKRSADDKEEREREGKTGANDGKCFQNSHFFALIFKSRKPHPAEEEREGERD